MTWAEVIQEARHRLDFVRRALDYQSTSDTGIQYLQRTHGKYLPNLLTETTVPRPRVGVEVETAQ